MSKALLVNEQSRFAYSEEMSKGSLDILLTDQWIFYSMLASIDRKNPHDDICVSARTIAALTGKRADNVKKQMRGACKRLVKEIIHYAGKIEIPTSKNKRINVDDIEFRELPLFTEIHYHPRTDMITASFNPKLLPIIMAELDSPVYKLNMVFMFKSKYSVRLLTLLIQKFLNHEKPSRIVVSVEELLNMIVSPLGEKRGKIGSTFGSLRRDVLAPAIEDINAQSYINITSIEEIRDENKTGPGKKAVVAVAFNIEEKVGKAIETVEDLIDAESELIRRGFSKSLAKNTVDNHSLSVIRRNMYYYDASKIADSKKYSPEAKTKILYSFIKKDIELEKRDVTNIITARENQILEQSELFADTFLEAPSGPPSEEFVRELKEKFPNLPI